MPSKSELLRPKEPYMLTSSKTALPKSPLLRSKKQELTWHRGQNPLVAKASVHGLEREVAYSVSPAEAQRLCVVYQVSLDTIT